MTIQTQTITNGRFLYNQMIDHIVSLIKKGTLTVGEKAPSLRRLSKQLGVSISTVAQAYVALEQRGVLKVRPQSGFYVEAMPGGDPPMPRKAPTSGKPRRVQMSQLFKDVFSSAHEPGSLPLATAVAGPQIIPVKAVARVTARVASQRPELSIDYANPAGEFELRRQIARSYMDLGLEVDPHNVIITAGASEALAISLQQLARPGDVVAVETPTYYLVLRLIERMGLLALEIETDPETGIDLQAMENALETMSIKAVLTIPNFSNPLGSLMPEDNKRRLVELAKGYGIKIIEDDVYGEIYFGQQRPGILRGYGGEGTVLTCSSYSKTLVPGYRIGWILTDQPMRDAVLEWKQATTVASATLPQLATAEFLHGGEYARQVVRLRTAVRAQVERMRFLVAKYFPEKTRVTNPKGGFVIWIELPRGNDSVDLFHRAMAQGIGLTPGILFSSTRRYRNFIRLNCGYPVTEAIEDGVRRLGAMIKG